MSAIDAAAAAIRTFGVVAAHNGVQRWYVYRLSSVKDGTLLPPDPELRVFFSRERAQDLCDRLNAGAVVEALIERYGWPG